METRRIKEPGRPMPRAPRDAGWAALAVISFALFASGAAAQTASPAADRIGFGDVVRVEVAGRQDLSATVTVDDQGKMTLPTVGVIQAAGRTTSEVSADISRRVSLTQRDAPHVRVSILEVRRRRIFVLGHVLLPGAYSFQREPTVWEAISEAGGSTDDANLAAVEVIPDDRAGDRKRSVVDVAAAIRTGTTASLPRLKPGDTVQVPGTVSADAAGGSIVYVLGAVGTQGAHALAPPTDLITTVIRCAPNADADLSKIEIVRNEGNRVVQMKVNARDYLSEAEPNGNPLLLPGDTIHVPRQSRGFGLFTIIGYVSPVIALATSIALLAR